MVAYSSSIILWYVKHYLDVPDINPEKKDPDHYLVNFENFWKTSYTLFVMTTLDNFPDVILGIVNDEPILLLFFFFFSIISGIIMISIMTGVFYTHFKDLYSATVDKLVSQKHEYKM